MSGTLYLVPTPIGNLEDITLRALRVLKDATLIAAEDTRTTGRLLAHFEIKTRQTSYHEYNKLTKLETVLESLETGDVALVSDAGTPGLSDPGYELIAACVARGIRVEPLPGPNAVITALVASGLPTDSFTYLGFMPRKQKTRCELLQAVKDQPRTLVFYESPHRLVDALSDLHEILGNRQVAIARELTKLHEEIWRGSVGDAITYFESKPPRGEFTIVVDGGYEDDNQLWPEEQVREAFAARLAVGESRSKAAKMVASDSGWIKSDIYDLDI